MGNKSNKSSLNKTWTNNKSNISTFESLNKNNNNINQANANHSNSLNLKKNKSDKKNKNEKKNEGNINIKKTINISYDGCIQKIKYFGKFDAESIKKIVKSRFFIEESIEQIFFQDEENDILILNGNIPDNITAYLYIQKDLIPKNPSNALKILKPKEELLKFHWILENENENSRFKNCIVDKYIYKNISNDECHPQVRSSITFKTGVHFCVIRVGSFDDYECLRVVEDSSPCINKEWDYKHNTIIGFSCNFFSYPRQYGKPLDVGILIDMKKKYVHFMIMK